MLKDLHQVFRIEPPIDIRVASAAKPQRDVV
jgi:hypothetical protein